ncbi:MAG: hypothetical protein R3E97_14860 [Candidatus Eisenbacteria bacterium]
MPKAIQWQTRRDRTAVASALLSATAITSVLIGSWTTATAAPTQSAQKLRSITTEVLDAADPILTEEKWSQFESMERYAPSLGAPLALGDPRSPDPSANSTTPVLEPFGLPIQWPFAGMSWEEAEALEATASQLATPEEIQQLFRATKAPEVKTVDLSGGDLTPAELAKAQLAALPTAETPPQNESSAPADAATHVEQSLPHSSQEPGASGLTDYELDKARRTGAIR